MYQDGYNCGYEKGFEAGCEYYRKNLIPERLTYLEEGLRCEVFCSNSMKSSLGCDGGCKIDEHTYARVLDLIHKTFDGIINN